jgi:hypothetical protein
VFAWPAVGRSLGLATVGLLVIALAAACGGNDADGSWDFDHFEEDRIAVEYPSVWTRDEAREGGESGTILSVHGRRDSDGLFPRLSVSRQEKEFASAEQAGAVLADLRPFQLNDGRAVSDGPARVEGADGAWRVVTRYALPIDDGETVPGRSVEVVALKDDERVIVTLAGPAKTMERLPVERIVGSLDLT